jgi:hypothetical protein
MLMFTALLLVEKYEQITTVSNEYGNEEWSGQSPVYFQTSSPPICAPKANRKAVMSPAVYQALNLDATETKGCGW